jgi:membrane peptidoglycan carboxypeptidase
MLNDSPQVYDLPDLKALGAEECGRAQHQSFMGPVRLRVALAQSLNTVASQLIYELKPAPVAAMAQVSWGLSLRWKRRTRWGSAPRW